MADKERNDLIKHYTIESVKEGLNNVNEIKKTVLVEGSLSRLSSKLTKSKISVNGNTRRSYIGQYISELVLNKTITLENGIIKLSKDDSINVTESDVKGALLNLLKANSFSKKDLIKRISSSLGADKTKSVIDDNKVKTFTDDLLSDLIKESIIEFKNDKYSIIKKNIIDKTVQPLELFKVEFFKRLHSNGGSFFERYLASLLERYYVSTDREVIECKVTGGSSDGGVDIILKIEDELGFIETIMVQAKNRLNQSVTEKEIREFYGAVNCLKGTRGMFVTTSSFHDHALKLLNSLDNCVGIDSGKLFELVLKTSYGVIKTKSGYKFDELVFDI